MVLLGVSAGYSPGITRPYLMPDLSLSGAEEKLSLPGITIRRGIKSCFKDTFWKNPCKALNV
jgi:hypothetical protein